MSLYVLLALTTSITRQRKQCQAFTLHPAGPLRCSAAAGMVPKARETHSVEHTVEEEGQVRMYVCMFVCALVGITIVAVVVVVVVVVVVLVLIVIVIVVLTIYP